MQFGIYSDIIFSSKNYTNTLKEFLKTFKGEFHVKAKDIK